MQKEPAGDAPATIILLTHRVNEGKMNAAIAAIEKLDTVIGSLTRIRLEHLDA